VDASLTIQLDQGGRLMHVIVTIMLAATFLGALAVCMTCLLGWANQVFRVQPDPRVEAILEALPGANCGGCGFPGCAEYAEAVASLGAATNLCGPGGLSCARQLAKIMGIEFSEAHPRRAVVHCAAHEDQRLQRMEYRGEKTCAAANLVPYVQGCTYGCLGLGDCLRACKYDAIHVIRGLATVDYDKCVGCAACVRACPRQIISVIPFISDRMLVVACSNQDFGRDVKAVCAVGCLGCKVCTRDNDLIEMDGNLPIIAYDKYDSQAEYESVEHTCKRDSLVFVGKPNETRPVTVARAEPAVACPSESMALSK
jgi:RnfABCDGE-type electron transport complex B subunit